MGPRRVWRWLKICDKPQASGERLRRVQNREICLKILFELPGFYPSPTHRKWFVTEPIHHVWYEDSYVNNVCYMHITRNANLLNCIWNIWVFNQTNAVIHGVAYSSLKDNNMYQCPLVVGYDRWSDDIYVVSEYHSLRLW